MSTDGGAALLSRLQDRSGAGLPVGAVRDHLQNHHGVIVTALTPLGVHAPGGLGDLPAGDPDGELHAVLRIDLADGRSWVARVFPPERRLADLEGDAHILRVLEAHGFPAERCATEAPVSATAGRGVIVTGFVAGERAVGRGHTFGVLGALLGRLHARTEQTSTPARPGGGWHHLIVQGSPAEELEAAMELADQLRARADESQGKTHRALMDALTDADGCDGLPEGLLHPDFVPVNTIVEPGGGLVVVDWAGAGRGPRLWALAFLLWAAGARDLRLVDIVVAHYARHVLLTEAELDRLPAAVRARPAVFACWRLATGAGGPQEVLEDLRWARRLSTVIADRARQGLRR
jgi:Ser/Thr protein kinase RdoA (MazF antagonist)